jgi:kumamolisin
MSGLPRSLLVLAVVGLTMALPAAYVKPSSVAHAAGVTTHVLSRQTPAVVAQHKASVRAHHNAAATLTLNIGLGVRNRAQLDTLISAASDPQSPAYGHYLTRAQYLASFAPTAQDVQDVRHWAQGVGLSVARTSPDNLLVTVRGTTRTIERALNVTINDYSVQGRTFMANDRDARVPATLNIRAISGMSTYHRYHTMLPQPLGLHSPNGAGHYYPDDFLAAYNAGSLANAGGQTIGLTLWGAPVPQSDLNDFATATGTPALVSGQAGSEGIDWIPVNGGSTDQSSQPEEAMDVEYAHGMAPGSHLKYWLADTLPGTCDASGNNCWPDMAGLEQALDAAANDPSVHVVSNSWGADEYDPTDPNQVNMQMVFQYADSIGTTFYFGSGDQGYVSGAPCAPDPTCTTAAPSFPSDSPYVVAVGGTNVQITADYSYSNETVWGSQSAAAAGWLPGTEPGATGGGCSTLLSRPSWQTGVDAADCPGRAVPDVSADADPYSGAVVCTQGACDGGYGGTSLAAPLWAGMAADVNAHLQASGLPVMGWAAPRLYQLANDPTTYARDFHDVVGGNNDPVVGSTNGYTATVGWDEATGWGSPNLSNLAADWPGQTVLPPTATATPTTIPPTATATPSAVPPTATATPTAVPPTATSRPMATAMTAAVPPAPTSTPVPSTNTPVAPHTLEIVATSTVQSHATSTPDPLRATAIPVTIPGLVIHVAALSHGRLAAHGAIAVTVKTRSHALVSISVAVTVQRVVDTGMGSQRKAKRQTVVLASRTIDVRANARGQVRANVRLAYVPRTVVPGLLTVTARTSWGVARRSQPLTVLPLPHRKPN